MLRTILTTYFVLLSCLFVHVCGSRVQCAVVVFDKSKNNIL